MESRKKAVSAVFVIAVVCLLSSPTTAQQSGPQSQQPTVSDSDLVKLHGHIKELKDPTFRAFLRMRLLSWESSEPGPLRRQAAMEVATQGITDLCEHEDEVWSPTASWLLRSLVNQIKTLQSPEATAVELCVLKIDTKSHPEKGFAVAISMLSNPETSAAGLNLAKAALLSGQVSAETMLGELLRLNATHSPHIPELLSATLTLEEKQPGTLPLRLLPFFSSVFLDKSVSPEIVTRFLFVAVRSSRVSEEELAKPTVGSPVRTLLNGIIMRAKQVAPELYPEIASRLRSLNPKSPNITETRLAAEERIQKASDQLEQLISEANSASYDGMRTSFLFRAARLAKEKGQLSKAVDLAMKIANERENSVTTSTWINDFLSEIVSLALKKQTPLDAAYAISNMPQHFGKAKAFRLLGEYYGENQDTVKSKEALTESAKLLKSVNNSNEKVRASLSLAESLLKYEPADAYEIFRDSVKAINTLPSPEKDKEKMYYLKLLPVADDLIHSFRLLAIRESATATNLAEEIKLSELRMSALSGAYSGRELVSGKQSN